jgi:hypothetical protein
LLQPPDAENRMSGGVGGWPGAIPVTRPDQEYGRQAERNGDDRSPGILLVAVLMEAEFRASDVAIDQASVGIVVGEPRLGGGAFSPYAVRLDALR